MVTDVELAAIASAASAAAAITPRAIAPRHRPARIAPCAIAPCAIAPCAIAVGAVKPTKTLCPIPFTAYEHCASISSVPTCIGTLIPSTRAFLRASTLPPTLPFSGTDTRWWWRHRQWRRQRIPASTTA